MKFTDEDKKVVAELEAIIIGSDSAARLTREEVYQQLITAKNSVATLTFEELLEKDMKLAKGGANQTVAVSSLPGILAQTLVAREQAVTRLEKFRAAGRYVALVVLGIDNNDNSQTSVRRDVAIYSPRSKLVEKVFIAFALPHVLIVRDFAPSFFSFFSPFATQ